MNKFVVVILFLSQFTNCKTTGKINTASLDHIPATFLGNFKDDYGISYTIDRQTWVQRPNIRYQLLKYDKEGQYFIARNDKSNPGEPGLYTRIDVTDFSNMEPWLWGFCLTEYKAKSFEEAAAKQSADRNNPKKGCGGYPFSRMKLEK
ncbi:MAG: hypothetical protein H7Y01_04125 [Ferruginibacter sp.]|nr:hypothetical protein [Chitinophagaceae bacterium]